MFSASSARLSRRSLLAAIGGSAVASRLCAQSSSSTPVVSYRIPRLRIGVAGSPSVTSPDTTSTMERMWLSSLVFDAPLRWNDQGDVIAGIFTIDPASNSGRMVLQPRPDAFFSDGTPITAAHAAETLRAVRETGEAWRLQNIETIDISADGQLELSLAHPDASLQAQLAHPAMGLHLQGLGTGPFQSSHATATTTTYHRNTRFWQIGRPHIDELTITMMPDDMQRSTALAIGKIDVLPMVPLLDVPMLANDPSLYLVGGRSNRLCHVQFRLTDPVLQHPRVRQIISAAIDRENLVSTATANQAEVATTLLPPKGWTNQVKPPAAIPPADALAELQALGIPSGARLHLLTDNADSTLANTAVVLQDQFASIGISLSITLAEGDELRKAADEGEYDLLVSYAEPWRDPHELLWPLLASSGPLNWSGYHRNEVDILLQAAISVSDPTFRIGRYTRLEELVQRDTPVTPLFRPYVFDAINAAYPGYEHMPPPTSRGFMTMLPTESR